MPDRVSDSEIAIYENRFSTEAAIKSTVYSRADENQAAINYAETKVKALKQILPAGRLISNNIQRMKEEHLLLMYRKVAGLGLPNWKPDVLRGNPESKYNLFHEYIALNTFYEVADTEGFAHVGINLSYVHNSTLMRKLYRSFVFSYMSSLAKLDARSPGAVAQGNIMDAIWKRRRSVCFNYLYFYYSVTDQNF